MAEEPKPKRAINPDDPDLTELEQALGYAIGAVEVHLKAQKRLLKVLCEMPEGPERDAQAKQFKEIFKETRALPPRPTREIVGFTAYLQPICTLVLALAVMSVGGSIAREAQNREMCTRRLAYGQEAMATLRFAQFKNWRHELACLTRPISSPLSELSVAGTSEFIGVPLR